MADVIAGYTKGLLPYEVFGEYSFAPSITVGAENVNVISVTVQAKGRDGTTLSGVKNFIAFLSDSASGVGVTASAPDGGVAAGSAGSIIAELSAGKVFLVQTDANGQAVLDITHSLTGTWYLVVLDPLGGQVVSGAITFA